MKRELILEIRYTDSLRPFYITDDIYVNVANGKVYQCKDKYGKFCRNEVPNVVITPVYVDVIGDSDE